MNPISCEPRCCPEETLVQVPGPTGPQGDPGTDGSSSFSLTAGTAGPFNKGDSVAITMAATSMFYVGEYVSIEDVNGSDPGFFQVTAKAANQLTLTYLNIGTNGNAVSIANGKVVSPSGPPFSTPLAVVDGGTGLATLTDRAVIIGRAAANPEFAAPGAAGQVLRSTGAGANPAFGAVDLADTDAVTGLLPIANVALGAAIPTVLTDNSTGTASNVIAAGAGQFIHSVYFRAAAITGNVLLYTYTPGFAYKIVRISAAIVDAITTGAKAATLTTAIAGTPTTGGVVTISGTYALGAEQASSSAITAANTGSTVQAITVTASAVTAFAEGGFMLQFQLQNMDTANAVASLSDHVNDVVDTLS